MPQGPFARLFVQLGRYDVCQLSLLDRNTAFGWRAEPIVIEEPTATALGVYTSHGGHGHDEGFPLSEVAARTVHEALSASALQSEQFGTSLVNALLTTNDALLREKKGSNRYIGCFSMPTVVAFDRTSLFVAHFGDDCALLLRRGGCFVLSRSQTLGRMRRDAGFEDGHHGWERFADAIMNPFGETARIMPVVSCAPLRRGDRLLLCTARARRGLDLKAIRAVLTEHQEPARMCEMLAQASAKGSGKAPGTFAVVDFLWDGWGEPTATAPAPIVVETSTAWFLDGSEGLS